MNSYHKLSINATIRSMNVNRVCLLVADTIFILYLTIISGGTKYDIRRKNKGIQS